NQGFLHLKMELLVFTFNDFEENTFVAYDDTGECIIIDPGCSTEEERTDLKGAIASKGLKPIALINTHCHIDHVLGNDFVASFYKLKLEAHKLEESVLAMQKQVAMMYGLPYTPSPPIETYLEEGHFVSFGNTRLGI